MAGEDIIAAFSRAIRVADQSCTGYSILRDRYRRRAMVLDLTILLISTWITAMVFVQPSIAIELSPNFISKDIWIGLLSIGAFVLSLVQLQVNWKGRADAYHSALSSLSSFVKEYRPLVSSVDQGAARIALGRYQVITESIEPIPDAQFLRLKQRHRLKIEMSKYLDEHPAASLLFLRLRLWLRDNKSNHNKNSYRE